MKKCFRPLLLAAALSSSLTFGASAESQIIPDDVTYQDLNGHQMAVKVYTLLPDQDPELLREEPFEHDGYRYELSDIVKAENWFDESSIHTETVTVNTETGDLEDVLTQLEPTMDYDDGTWAGTLALDHSTIKTKAAGYTTANRTVTATKRYTGLDRNDSSYIDPAVVQNGRTLSLSNVVWNVESTALVGDELVPETYSAVATYSGTSSYSVATGYITTADYIGSVTSAGISSIRYTVTFSGTEIEENDGVLPEELPVVIAVIIFILLAVLVYMVFQRMNTTVYREGENPNEYEKCGHLRISPRDPKLDLSRLEDEPSGRIAVEITAPAARKLFGKTIEILHMDTVRHHTVDHTDGAYWFKLDLRDEPDGEGGENV